MFTGIIEELGRIVATRASDNGVRLEIVAQEVSSTLKPGASVAINGVCQTVLRVHADRFQVAAEEETLRVTTLGSLRAGDIVNLERALPAQGRLDGHVVLGHVDGKGEIRAVERQERTHVLEIRVPEALRPYVVPKGCIAVEGVSLTVGPDIQNGSFRVFIIPYTWEHTSLQHRIRGDWVNLETDILGRYVVQFLQNRESREERSISLQQLEKMFSKRSQL